MHNEDILLFSGGLSSTLYSISFLYYAVIALVVTIIFGLIASFLTGKYDLKKQSFSFW